MIITFVCKIKLNFVDFCIALNNALGSEID